VVFEGFGSLSSLEDEQIRVRKEHLCKAERQDLTLFDIHRGTRLEANVPPTVRGRRSTAAACIHLDLDPIRKLKSIMSKILDPGKIRWIR